MAAAQYSAESAKSLLRLSPQAVSVCVRGGGGRGGGRGGGEGGSSQDTYIVFIAKHLAHLNSSLGNF